MIERCQTLQRRDAIGLAERLTRDHPIPSHLCAQEAVQHLAVRAHRNTVRAAETVRRRERARRVRVVVTQGGVRAHHCSRPDFKHSLPYNVALGGRRCCTWRTAPTRPQYPPRDFVCVDLVAPRQEDFGRAERAARARALVCDEVLGRGRAQQVPTFGTASANMCAHACACICTRVVRGATLGHTCLACPSLRIGARKPVCVSESARCRACAVRACMRERVRMRARERSAFYMCV